MKFSHNIGHPLVVPCCTSHRFKLVTEMWPDTTSGASRMPAVDRPGMHARSAPPC